MKTLSLFLLGEPRIERDGNPVQFDTRKAVALLAYLAVTREGHSRDALAALLYPESDQVKSRGALRRTLSALKQALGDDWLAVDRETISFVPLPGLVVDVDEFHRLIGECARHGHAPNDVCSACIGPLSKAVSLYRDDFLSGFTLRDSPNFDDWQFFQSETLRRELVSSLAKLVCRCSEDGLYQEAISYSRRWLALEPLEEAGHRQLMYLYAWTGQRTAALRQYRECVRLLEQELGVAPLEETKQLARAIEESREARPTGGEGREARGGKQEARGAGREARDRERATGRKPQPRQEHSGSGAGVKEKEAGGRPELAEGTRPSSSVVRPSSAPRAPRPARLASPSAPYPLVGRGRELNELLTVYRESSSTGHFLVLEGEAGIGKTRLAEEFLAQVRSEGAVTVTARCYEGQGNLAYGPFVEGLRALNLPAEPGAWLEQTSPETLAEAARLLPELGSIQPLPSVPPLEGPGGQSRFMESISQLLRALGGTEGCTVLFLDDLQWADAASLDLLAYLVRRLKGRSLYILGTWRSEEVGPDHQLRQMMAEAQRAGTGEIVQLERLDRTAVMQLVEAAAQDGTVLNPQMAERLYHESEGQPFFLVEYLALLSNGQGTSGEWSLPGSVRAILRSRLARVSETARQLLSAAAVIGRSFDFDTLSVVSGRSDLETVSGLEELLALGLVQEVRPGNDKHELLLDFVHDKLRALVYEETSIVRRRLVHRRVAEALANRARLTHDTDRLSGQIARHYAAGGHDHEAAEYFKTAGDYARSLYANAKALEDYRAALALGYPNTALLHKAIGDLQTLSGEYSAALHSYETALALQENDVNGGIESKIAEVYARRGEWDQAEKHFQAALDALGANAPRGMQSTIYGDMSLVALRSGDAKRAEDLARRALELAKETHDRHAIAQAHNIFGILARHARDTDAALAHLQESLSLGESIEDPGVCSAALNNLALVCMDRGDVAAGIAYTEKALALSRAQGDRHREAALHNNLADLFHAAGVADAAMDHLRQAVTIYAEIGAEAGTWQPEIWKLAEW